MLSVRMLCYMSPSGTWRVWDNKIKNVKPCNPTINQYFTMLLHGIPRNDRLSDSPIHRFWLTWLWCLSVQPISMLAQSSIYHNWGECDFCIYAWDGLQVPSLCRLDRPQLLVLLGHIGWVREEVISIWLSHMIIVTAMHLLVLKMQISASCIWELPESTMTTTESF